MNTRKSNNSVARKVAYEILLDVAERDGYANLLLPSALQKSGLSSKDSAFVTELVANTLRLQGLYDMVIQLAAKRQANSIEQQVLILLRLGAHQILNMRVPKHAAVFETVKVSKSKGLFRATGFINAVLRRVSEKNIDEWITEIEKQVSNEQERLSVVYSHPTWIIESFAEALRLTGREHQLEALLQSDNNSPSVSLAIFDESLQDQFEGETGISPFGLNLNADAFKTISQIEKHAGLVRVQDQGSQMAALLLTRSKPVVEGELWLDLCAGPGGKTAVLASEAQKHGVQVIANELFSHRAKLVKESVKAFADVVSVKVGDGTRDTTFVGKLFDRILVDAPCSGLGALRRRPEARWRKTEEDLPDLISLQEKLLHTAARHLKQGGVIAYVTCSPHLRETREQVNKFLRENNDFKELDANALFSSIRVDKNDNNLNGGREGVSLKSLQLWPHIHETDAMFVSLLQKSPKDT